MTPVLVDVRKCVTAKVLQWHGAAVPDMSTLG